MSTKRARKLRVAAEADLSVVADGVVMVRAAVAATVETGAIAAARAAVAGAVHVVVENLGTNQFQALDASFIRKGELLWLEDRVLLFKNAKRNSLGKRSRKTKQQSAPSGILIKTRRGQGIWTTISITAWLTTPMKKYCRRSMSHFSIQKFNK
jgi:hypothetical protein